IAHGIAISGSTERSGELHFGTHSIYGGCHGSLLSARASRHARRSPGSPEVRVREDPSLEKLTRFHSIYITSPQTQAKSWPLLLTAIARCEGRWQDRRHPPERVPSP